jgi:hypothetical protein
MADRTGLRYRVFITIVDLEHGGAFVDMYDAATLKVRRGRERAHPQTVHLVREVCVGLGAAVRLCSDDLPPEVEGR